VRLVGFIKSIYLVEFGLLGLFTVLSDGFDPKFRRSISSTFSVRVHLVYVDAKVSGWRAASSLAPSFPIGLPISPSVLCSC